MNSLIQPQFLSRTQKYVAIAYATFTFCAVFSAYSGFCRYIHLKSEDLVIVVSGELKIAAHHIGSTSNSEVFFTCGRKILAMPHQALEQVIWNSREANCELVDLEEILKNEAIYMY